MKQPNREKIHFQVNWGRGESYGVKYFDSADSAETFFCKMFERHPDADMKLCFGQKHTISLLP